MLIQNTRAVGVRRLVNKTVLLRLGTFALGLSMVSACGEAPLSPVDYVQWVQDEKNPLTKTKSIDGFEFTAQYRPVLYQAIQELKATGKLQTASIQTKAKEYEGLRTFIFRIATSDHKTDVLKADIATPQEYYKKLQYFTSSMQNDFLLVVGRDTVRSAFVNFERTYSASPFSTFTVAFDTPQNKDHKENIPLTLIYQDQILGTGPVHISFSASDFNHTPQLSAE